MPQNWKQTYQWDQGEYQGPQWASNQFTRPHGWMGGMDDSEIGTWQQRIQGGFDPYTVLDEMRAADTDQMLDEGDNSVLARTWDWKQGNFQIPTLAPGFQNIPVAGGPDVTPISPISPIPPPRPPGVIAPPSRPTVPTQPVNPPYQRGTGEDAMMGQLNEILSAILGTNQMPGAGATFTGSTPSGGNTMAPAVMPPLWQEGDPLPPRKGDPRSPGGGYPRPPGGGDRRLTPGEQSAVNVQQAQLLTDLIARGEDVDLSGVDPAVVEMVLSGGAVNPARPQQTNGPVTMPGGAAVFTVPGENLSPAIDDTLLDVMAGVQGTPDFMGVAEDDPLGMQARLQDLLTRTQGGGVNSQRLLQRREAARENLTTGLDTTLADLRSVLADRNLLGSPMEGDASARVMQPLQRDYLSQLREAELDESIRADEAEMGAIKEAGAFSDSRRGARMDALSKATGFSMDVLDQRLAGAKTAQERQRVMAELAYEGLDKNMEWNKFLAEHGLRREEVMAAIQEGRINSIMPVIQLYMNLLQQSRGGYIGA